MTLEDKDNGKYVMEKDQLFKTRKRKRVGGRETHR